MRRIWSPPPRADPAGKLDSVEQLAHRFLIVRRDANDIQSLAALGDHEWVAGFKEMPLLVHG
ncbi:MAG: hypothetical protein IPK16_29195 [Anaerolineales bacterium]|nr:hypothetical protein [Anaerolineales bacterium]